ncbi:hypothetical protein THAOC_36691, partial [Thalassiosira oceanica]
LRSRRLRVRRLSNSQLN